MASESEMKRRRPQSQENFDGFITPDGRLVAIQDAESVYTLIVRSTDRITDVIQALRGCAGECAEKGYLAACCAYMEKALPLLEDPAEKAACLLSLGRIREQMGDFGAALRVYSRAFELPQERNDTWYFLHNNLAYCLNREERYEEAEKHCRMAIRIKRRRHNAHKNLGVALQGRGRYVAAAKSFLRATRLCPVDARALRLLQELLTSHGEVLEEEPAIRSQLLECHEAVQSTRGVPRLQ